MSDPWSLLGAPIWWLAAQGPTPGVLDSIPGAPAWVGTGLLGGVLGWLLFVHLPNKDKQLAEKDARHDAHTEALTAKFNQTMTDVIARYTEQEKERRTDYREALAVVVSHCEKETAQTGAIIKKNLDGFSQLMEEVRDELRRFRGEGRTP